MRPADFTPPTRPPVALTAGELRAAMAALLATILLAALDQTIVGVAVPTIAHQLGGFEWMAWVISGYLIAATVVTPLYGKAGDRFGRRSVMSFAIGLFLIASVACALAQSMPQLVVARVLQGAGGGGLIAVAQAVIADIVPLRDRGRYQSHVSVVWAVASLLGPVVGGVLTDYLSWPWIFWINLPVGLVALVGVRRALTRLPAGNGTASIDARGALLLLAGLTALLLPITRIGQGAAWNEPLNGAVWAAAIGLLGAFAMQQRRHADPIVPLALFANRSVLACAALLFICFFNFIALSVLVPLRVQLVVGLSASDAALHILPLTLAVPFAAFICGRWLSHSGRVLPALRLGVVLVPLGLLATGLAGPTGAAATLALVVTGLGLGLQMPTVLITVQQSVPHTQIGTVTALTAFFRQLGGAVGIAVLGSVVLGLLLGQLPGAGPAAGGAEGLGAMLGTGAPRVGDSAFRSVMHLAALLSLIGPWLALRLPDVRLHDAAARPADHPA